GSGSSNTNPTTCFNNLQATMQSLLTGGSNTPPIPFNIPSKFAVNPQTGQLSQSGANALMAQEEASNGTGAYMPACSGINNCITALQNLKTDRTTYASTLDQRAQTYSQNVKSYVQNNILQPSAQRLSSINQQLMNQLQGMGQMLSQFGGQVSIKPGTVQAEQMQYDSDNYGIPKPPSSMAGLLSGMMQPPLADLGDTYDSINSAIADAQKSLQTNQAKVT